MKKIIVIFKWILTSVLLLFLLGISNERQKSQKIILSDIILKDSEESFVNKENILKHFKHNKLEFDDVLINDFSAQELECFLDGHPFIKDVEVFLDKTGSVNILIDPKKAIVRVKSDVDDYYLDEFGQKMQLSDIFIPKLPVATGNISSKDHISIYRFIKLINQMPFWRAQITQIHFTQDDILLIPRIGSQKINIGSFENILEKLDNLYQFYLFAMPVKGWELYSDINLKFKNQIVCTKK